MARIYGTFFKDVQYNLEVDSSDKCVLVIKKDFKVQCELLFDRIVEYMHLTDELKTLMKICSRRRV